MHLNKVNSVEEFKVAWNGMGKVDGNDVSIDNVVIYSHTNERAIILLDGSNTNALSIDGKNSKGGDIGNLNDLEKKDVGQLFILGCNSGHLASLAAGQNNLATFFLSTVMGNNGVVYAYDGEVSFGHWDSYITGDYSSHLSSKQETFHEINKKYGQDDREPYGMLKFYFDSYDQEISFTRP